MQIGQDEGGWQTGGLCCDWHIANAQLLYHRNTVVCFDFVDTSVAGGFTSAFVDLPLILWIRQLLEEVGQLTSSWHKNMNCYRATVVCLDAKGLWKPGQSFILAGFTLSLPRSAPCGTEQTTIDTGCDPTLPRNCVDHPADCNLFKTITLLNSH